MLNGVDYEAWNPQTDPLLPEHYSAGSIEGKYTCRQALRDRFWLRKGRRPVVRATGGMNDTVFDYDHSTRLAAERNGYVFHHTDHQAIESALSRALALWLTRPRDFRRIVANGMRADYSWTRPGQEYLDIYQYIQPR